MFFLRIWSRGRSYTSGTLDFDLQPLYFMYCVYIKGKEQGPCWNTLESGFLSPREPCWKSPLTSALVSRRVIKCQLHSELQGSRKVPSGPPQQGATWEQEISRMPHYPFCYLDREWGVCSRMSPYLDQACYNRFCAPNLTTWSLLCEGCPLPLPLTPLGLHTGLGGQHAFH